MNRICWWLVDRLSRGLDRDEREAVCGDLVESFESGAQALWELCGLLVRRQLALWRDWRPWLALVALANPLGILLSVVSAQWSTHTSIYTWLYINHWSWNILALPAARRDLLQTTAEFLLDYVTLICWSAAIGFVCASLSRRASWLTGALFCVVLFGGTLATTPPGRQNPLNAPVFSSPFFGVLLPVAVRTIFIILPFLWGMGKSRRHAVLPLWQTSLLIVPTITLTMRAAASLEYAVLFAWWQLFPPVDWRSFPRDGTSTGRILVSITMLWPITYMAVSSGWQRLRRT